MKFEYFNGREPASNCYFVIPKCLNTDPELRKISVEARYLYGLMLDKMKYAALMNQVDKQGKTFIYYKWEDISRDIGKGRNTVFKLLEELDVVSGVGLIERVVMGQGRQSRIYVMRIVEAEQKYNPKDPDMEEKEKTLKFKNRDSEENAGDPESQNLNFKNVKNGDSCMPDFNTQEVYDQGRINKNINNKNIYNKNLIRIYPSRSMKEKMDGMGPVDDEAATRAYVREDIGTDVLCERFPDDEGIIRGIEDLLVDVLTSNRPRIMIGGEERDTNVVKGRFMKLNQFMVEDVVGRWKSLTNAPKNPRAYMLAMLFNISITHAAQIEAEVNQGMAYGIGVKENDREELLEG